VGVAQEVGKEKVGRGIPRVGTAGDTGKKFSIEWKPLGKVQKQEIKGMEGRKIGTFTP